VDGFEYPSQKNQGRRLVPRRECCGLVREHVRDRPDTQGHGPKDRRCVRCAQLWGLSRWLGVAGGDPREERAQRGVVVLPLSREGTQV